MDVVDAPACLYGASGDELTSRPSPPDSSVVRLGEGAVKVCYSAPSARGRQVFGGLVPYGRPWRLGANEATTIHVTVPAEIGTVRVEPGTYSLYAIPGESEWTIVVNRAADRWGIPIDEGVRAQDVGSFTVAPETTDHVERFSIDLEPAEDGAAQMVIAWETTRVTFPVRAAGSLEGRGGENRSGPQAGTVAVPVRGSSISRIRPAAGSGPARSAPRR